MKECLHCHWVFSSSDWLCPKCRWKPARREGFICFAPDLAARSDGYAPELHEDLVRLEARCFWFRNRNRLLQFAMDEYFSSSRCLLEIGCGTGFVLAGFDQARPQMHLTGADIHVSGLKPARKRIPRAEFIQMDARHIPFVDEFDVIGAFDVIEHIEEDEAALKEMHKALKPEAGLILTVPQHRRLWSTNDEIACHKRRYSQAELCGKLRKVGFRILRISSFVSFLLPLMLVSRFRFNMERRKQSRQSVFDELNMAPVLNTLFERVCDVERVLLGKGVSFPVGGSLLCIGIKE